MVGSVWSERGPPNLPLCRIKKERVDLLVTSLLSLLLTTVCSSPAPTTPTQESDVTIT